MVQKKKPTEKKGKKAKKHFSEVVVVTCGDYRIVPIVRKYLKEIRKLWEMDFLTSAGGSRVISFYDIKESDEVYAHMKIKEEALWIDFTTYLGHNAKNCVLADHNACGMWPTFGSEEEEDSAHIKSLIRSREIILGKYPSLKRVILLYVITHPLTHKPIKIKIIDARGKPKTIIIKKSKKLLIDKTAGKSKKKKKN